jgi:dTDP-4-dehydrorhamnose reductase
MSLTKNWLILGGSGQLGSNLNLELRKRGIVPTIFSSRDLDIRDFDKTFQVIRDLGPDFIVNCAAWTNVRTAEFHEKEAEILNGGAVANIGLAVQDSGGTLIHVSTDYVFSGQKSLPYEITDEMDPINAYGRTKAIGENLLAEVELERCYVMRTAWLYGLNGKNFIKTILGKYISGEARIEIVDDQFGNPTSSLDLSKQLIDAAELNIPYGTYHAVNTGVTSWFGLAYKAFEMLKLDTEKLFAIPTPGSVQFTRPQNSSLNTGKWAEHGIQEMRPWEDALGFVINDIFTRVQAEGTTRLE